MGAAVEVVWNLSLSFKPTVDFLDAVSVFPIVGLTETATDLLEAHLESMADGSARECYDGAPLLTTPGQRADFERAIVSVATNQNSTGTSLNSSMGILEASDLAHYRSVLSAGMGWKTDALDKWALWRNLTDGGGGGGGEVAAPFQTRPLIWGSVTCSICFDEVENPALGNALEGCGHWCW